MTIQQAIDLIVPEMAGYPYSYLNVTAGKSGILPNLKVEYSIYATLGESYSRELAMVHKKGPNLESLATLVAGLLREEIANLKAPKEETPIDGVTVGMEVAPR